MDRLIRPAAGRPVKTEFADYVDRLRRPSKILGLTHITSSYILRDILKDKNICSIKKCKVLDESLTYAFYGRAAFRGSNDDNPATLASLFPSVFILDPELVPKPKYVFGFDSGAFAEGMMDQYLHPDMPLFDFLLSNSPLSAARLVAKMFGGNEEFLRNKPTRSSAKTGSNFELESYRQIVLGFGRGSNILDDRASTPELAFDTALSLKDCVRAVVMPDTLASDKNIGGKLRQMGITVEEYMWVSGNRPSETHGLIRSIVESLYRRLGWL